MAYEQKENQGSLFKNTRKEQENHADWQGEIKIDGKLRYLNAWEKQGKSGVFLSVSLGKEKVARSGGQSQRQAPARTEYPKPTKTQPVHSDVKPQEDDDVPFKNRGATVTR